MDAEVLRFGGLGCLVRNSSIPEVQCVYDRAEQGGEVIAYS